MTVLDTSVMLIFYLVIALLISMQAYLGQRTLLFGITLPAEALQDLAVRSIRRNYVLLTGGLTVVIGIACYAVTRQQPAGRSMQAWMCAILLVTFVSLFAIGYSRMAAERLKAARGWQVAVQSKRAASLTAGRTSSPVLGIWWYSAHIAVTGLCIYLAAARWNMIPQLIGVHMGAGGSADRYIHKSLGSVFMMNILQALMILLFAGFNMMISRARTSLDPQDREGSLQKQLAVKRIYSVAAWGISLLGMVNLGLLQAVMLYGWNLKWLSRFNLLFLAVFCLTLVGVMLCVKFRGLDQQRDIPSQEERHWKWLGSIYANPEDPALFVPDRYGLGWTINMGNLPGKSIAAAVIAILVIANLVIIFNFE